MAWINLYTLTVRIAILVIGFVRMERGFHIALYSTLLFRMESNMYIYPFVQ